MAYTTIDNPELYFQVKIYAGDGSADHAITLDGDTDMQPDLVWIKNRDVGDPNCIFDSVRGATKVLDSASTAAEVTDADTLDAFQSNGFKVDADDKVNTSGEDFVAWCWKESATAGFDINIHTGTGSSTDISHSLSAVPEMIFTKRRNDTQSWFTYTSTGGSQKAIFLDTDSAVTTQATAYDAAPTSSVINYGNDNGVNGSSDTYVAYLWRSVQGFSKFGTYQGNDNADGTFVYTGFRPAYVLVKRTDSAVAWNHYDNKRILFRATSSGYGYNTAVDMRMYPNTNGDEENYTSLDILSNGFKIRINNAYLNASGGTYIYMAFAEAPFVNSNGVPCNAR